MSSKHIVHAGKDEPPMFSDGTKAVFHYRVKSPAEGENCCGASHILDDSREPWPRGYGQPMELIFGKKFKLPIWETCLRTMRVDEVSEFTLDVKDIVDYPFVSKQLRDLAKQRSHDHHGHGEHDHCPAQHSCMGMVAQTGLGYPELDEWLRKPTQLIFTFHLLSVLQPDEYEREGWTLTSEQKLASIPQLKERGNDYFKQGKLDEALARYGEALSRLETLSLREKPGEPEWKALDMQKLPFYSNIAQIKLQQKDYYAAIEACTEALKRDPGNGKALYRRAKAHMGAWNLQEARKDLEMLREVDATCHALVEKEFQTINNLEQKMKSDEAARFRNVFS